MNQKTKLLFAMMQVDNLTSLIEGNEYQKFLYLHLNQVRVELKRQLTNLTHSTKINNDALIR
jgi:hypothetical protein